MKMLFTSKSLLVWLLLLAPAAGVSQNAVSQRDSIPLNSIADAVSEWHTIMLNTTAAVIPFNRARLAAITQLAVFEAVKCMHSPVPPISGHDNRPGGRLGAGCCDRRCP